MIMLAICHATSSDIVTKKKARLSTHRKNVCYSSGVWISVRKSNRSYILSVRLLPNWGIIDLTFANVVLGRKNDKYISLQIRILLEIHVRNDVRNLSNNALRNLVAWDGLVASDLKIHVMICSDLTNFSLIWRENRMLDIKCYKTPSMEWTWIFFCWS